jgi:3-oxoacyl-[acyl-carrier protein] reductase
MTPEREEYDELVSSAIPMGIDQTAEEIAAAVAFLCSDLAPSITGQVLAIDGGMTLGRAS